VQHINGEALVCCQAESVWRVQQARATGGQETEGREGQRQLQKTKNGSGEEASGITTQEAEKEKEKNKQQPRNVTRTSKEDAIGVHSRNGAQKGLCRVGGCLRLPRVAAG
jgi:hypothetical protein